MGAFVAYIIKAAFCLLVLFAFNKLVMGKETFHEYNRWAWIAVIGLSMVLPIVHFEFWEIFTAGGGEVAAGMVPGDVGVLPEAGDYGFDGAANPFQNFVFWGGLAYIVGAGAVIAVFAVSYAKLLRLLVQSCDGKEYAALLLNCKKAVGYGGKVRLLITRENISPMSWMHYVVMKEEDAKEDGRAILIHEISHIKAGHSWDMLLADTMIVFQWFNPAAWLLKQSLQQVQEYCADSSVLEAGVDARSYQLLLIKKAVGQRLYSMANSFNHSKLKNRITMMLKEKSSKWAYAKCLYIIPMALATGSLFATPKVSSAMGLISEVKGNEKSVITDTIPKTDVGQTEEVVVVAYGSAQQKIKEGETLETLRYAEVDVKPLFFGENPNRFSKWVSENLEYPEEVKKAGTQGRITYQFTIDENGKVCNAKLLRGMAENMPYAKLLNDEGIRVIESSPDWIPGSHKGKPVRVIFNFPIIFQLSDSKAETGGTKESAQSSSKEASVLLPGGCVPFSSLDVKPSFKANMMGRDVDSFTKWIAMQLIYPEQAKANKITGRVTIRFVIDTDGSLTDVEVIRGVSKTLDDEALRVVKMSPKWSPAMKDGKAVKVQMHCPVDFMMR